MDIDDSSDESSSSDSDEPDIFGIKPEIICIYMNDCRNKESCNFIHPKFAGDICIKNLINKCMKCSE